MISSSVFYPDGQVNAAILSANRQCSCPSAVTDVLGFEGFVLLLKQTSYYILPMLCCMSKQQEPENSVLMIGAEIQCHEQHNTCAGKSQPVGLR